MKYNNSSFYKGEFVRNNMSVVQKRGQVTIFIIIAIIVVAIILFSYFYLYPKYMSQSDKRPMLDRCIQDEMKKQIVSLSLDAGMPDSKFRYMYLDENISFICYTNEYYKPCVVQQPFLKETFEKSLSKKMEPVIQQCYDNAINDLITRGNDVSSGDIKTNITIDPNGVSVLIDAPTSVSNGKSSASFSKIRVNLESNIYTILAVASSLLQFESSYGDSDTSSFNFYYPDLNVQKIRRDDSVKIYIITDKKDIKYRFASRSYAWPPGYGSTNA
jgi:hypothetical protein